jgi:hypothetical protein
LSAANRALFITSVYPSMTVSDLPAINASLNALSTLFIVLGSYDQKERKVAHGGA